VAKKIAQELALLKAGEIIEEFKELLVKDHELVSYGLGNVYNAAVIGAVKKLVVVDELLRSPNEEERRLVYETLNAAHSRRAEVVIIPGKSDIGAEVLGFGGVIAINRFKLQLNIEEFEKN
jgi:protein pelota